MKSRSNFPKCKSQSEPYKQNPLAKEKAINQQKTIAMFQQPFSADKPTVKLDERGLIPAIVQDSESGQVLMLAWMNAEALRLTLEGPHVWFYSRSRKALWRKGESSGNVLEVVEVSADCDSDVLLVKARPAGPVCHTENTSCFYAAPFEGMPQTEKTEPERGGLAALTDLWQTLVERRDQMPEESYTSKLLAQGLPRVAQKVVEEAGETVIAACCEKENVPEEMADLIYHSMVLLLALEIEPSEVLTVLEKRAKSRKK